MKSINTFGIKMYLFDYLAIFKFFLTFILLFKAIKFITFNFYQKVLQELDIKYSTNKHSLILLNYKYLNYHTHNF